MRIKAEEEEAREKSECSNKMSSDDNDDNSNENEMPSTPKLTRFKSKQLNKNPMLVVPLKSFSSEPNEEVVALIHNELKSDEDDDEYQPHDTHSDDDVTNTTMSDMDSQPSTPGSALLYNDDFDSPVKEDFKIPRTPLTAVSCIFEKTIFNLMYFCILGGTRKHISSYKIEIGSSNNSN